MASGDDMIEVGSTFASDVRQIIDEGVRAAYSSVEQIAVMTFWKVGRRICEEIKCGSDRAEYVIVNTRVHNLRWSHYRALLTVENDDARYWYLREAS